MHFLQEHELVERFQLRSCRQMKQPQFAENSRFMKLAVAACGSRKDTDPKILDRSPAEFQ